MNKVKLQLDDLQVESFAVQADVTEPGTVHGRQVADEESRVHSACYTWCINCESLQATNCPLDRTCAESCYPSCNYTACPDVYTCYPCEGEQAG